MGSASTGQVMAEAPGLTLPGSALTPAPLARLLATPGPPASRRFRLIQTKPDGGSIRFAVRSNL